jgi:hypothetical protein
VTLCLDFLYVNKLIMMHAIIRKLQHRWVCFPESRGIKYMKRNLNALRRVYHSRGFRVVTVHADEEFEKLRNHMLPSRLNTPNPGGRQMPSLMIPTIATKMTGQKPLHMTTKKVEKSRATQRVR